MKAEEPYCWYGESFSGLDSRLNQPQHSLSQNLIQSKTSSLHFCEAWKRWGCHKSEVWSQQRLVHETEGKKPPQNIKAQSETASADVEAMANYSDLDLKKKKNEGDYTEQQTFKVGETAFYWKKMPSRTFIDREERSVSDFKGSKDRLTLLLGTIMQLITWNWSQCSFAILKTPGPLRIMPKLFCLWLMNGTTKPEWQHLFL